MHESKLLLVEDDTITAKILEKQLVSHGFELDRCGSISAAKRLLMNPHHYACLLLDYFLPDGTALDIAHLLQTSHQQLPIVVLSATQDPEVVAQAFRTGISDFLLKDRELAYLHRLPVVIHHLVRYQVAETQVEEMQSALQLTRLVFEENPNGVFVMNGRSELIMTNPAFCRLVGHTEDALLGIKSHQVVPDFYLSTYMPLLEKGEVVQLELGFFRRSDGEELLFEVMIFPLEEDTIEQHCRFVAMVEDISMRKQQEEKIWRQANYDALTGLPNRQLFIHRLEQLLSEAERKPLNFAVLFLDLDNFKWVNDTLGHDYGDELLKQVAMRLSMVVRGSDTLSRLGGDEFTFIFEDYATSGYLHRISNRILEVLSDPFDLKDHQRVFIGGTIGMATFPTDGHDAKTLIKHADMAMYRAKDAGKNQYLFYNEEMSQQVQQRMRIEEAMRYALEGDEFYLNYQPIMDGSGARMQAAEVVLRWQSPQLGFISPADFIPVAEETGMILDIGAWVLRTACEQYVSWMNEGLEPFVLSVNLSPVQFEHAGIVEFVETTLDEVGMDPACLKLEVTEGTLVKHPEVAVLRLQALSDLGLSLSLDDFGTGYSSLNYLQRFALDSLKIDRSFVINIASDRKSEAIAATIMTLGKRLGLEVIAEGVETQEQADLLNHLGHCLIQGYLFSKPLSTDPFEQYVLQLEQ